MNRIKVLFLTAAIVAAVVAQFGDLSCAQAASRHRMSFTPGDRSRPAFHVRSARRATGGRHGSRHVTHAPPHRGRGRAVGGRGRADEGGGTAVPGAGFKLEDGVLTYPAPARFQPHNLKHP